MILGLLAGLLFCEMDLEVDNNPSIKNAKTQLRGG
jgi:hypothetical protein